MNKAAVTNIASRYYKHDAGRRSRY